MRLEGKKAMGYFPTPPELVPVIRSYLAFPDSVAALDPFAGEGYALQALCEGTKATTWGIELDNHRAAAAKKRLYRVAVGDMMAAKVSHGSVGLLYFNPPYDWTAKTAEEAYSVRSEAYFLRRCTEYLRAGGVFIGLVPQPRVGDIARMLSTNYAQLLVVRFPDEQYRTYKQVVIFGLKRNHPTRDKAVEEYLKRVPHLDAGSLSVLEMQSAPTYQVAPTPGKIPLFSSGILLADEAREIERTSLVWGEMGKLLTPTKTELTDNPPLPFHTGHQASLLASGALNGAMGNGADRHLVRGLVTKVVDEEEYEEEDQHGNPVYYHRSIDKYVIKIRVLTATGEHLILA